MIASQQIQKNHTGSPGRFFWYLLALFVAAYLADLGLTLYGLKAGWLVEMNPLMCSILARGPGVTLAFKLGLLAAFVAVVLLCTNVNPRLALWAVALAFFVYSLIVLWHLTGLACIRANWLPPTS